MLNRKVKIFCSYSHRDEKLREELEDHLAVLRREGLLTLWTDRHIEAGEQWRDLIDENLETADIVLLLISKDFLDSEYCVNIEMTRALERHRQSQIRVIPVILRACDWESTTVGRGDEAITLSELQALPICPPPASKLLPVKSWPNEDEGFTAVAKGIRRVVEEMTGTESPSQLKKVSVFERPSPTVPELLPHLCNRSPQERALKEAVLEWQRHGKAKRPLVCIVHGEVNECHEMYQRRLVEETLPRLLRDAAPKVAEASLASIPISIDSIFIPLRIYDYPSRVPFEFLRSELGQAIVDDVDASPPEIANGLSRLKRPVMFFSHFSSLEWEPNGAKTIESYLRFWNALPELSSGPAIICCLFFKYHERSGEERNAAARQYFNSIADSFSSYRKMRAVVLPELPGVEFRDVENWIHDHRHFRSLCPVHTRSFCNIPEAAASINAIFGTPEAQSYGGKLPMQFIAPKLIQVIMDHRC